MTGFLTFLVVIAAIVMLFRYLRQREIEAFRDADLSVFENFNAAKKLAKVDPLVQAYTDKTAATGTAQKKVVNLPQSVIVDTTYELKETIFDDIHGQFLALFNQVLGDRYQVFARVAFADFLRVESPLLISGKSIAFLICHRANLDILCGVHLQEAGVDKRRHRDLLQEVFRQIHKPLIEFPFVGDISLAEIQEKLKPLIASSPLSRNCPKCGREMVMRKAVKGRNTGKTFWVCTDFPGCSGISRIGKF